MTRIDEAQRMASQLDQGANARAAVTAKTIGEDDRRERQSGAEQQARGSE